MRIFDTVSVLSACTVTEPPVSLGRYRETNQLPLAPGLYNGTRTRRCTQSVSTINALIYACSVPVTTVPACAWNLFFISPSMAYLAQRRCCTLDCARTYAAQHALPGTAVTYYTRISDIRSKSCGVQSPYLQCIDRLASSRHLPMTFTLTIDKSQAQPRSWYRLILLFV